MSLTTLIENEKVIQIIKSHWDNYYHVIIEDPTEGDLYYKHEFKEKEEVEREYNTTIGDF